MTTTYRTTWRRCAWGTQPGEPFASGEVRRLYRVPLRWQTPPIPCDSTDDVGCGRSTKKTGSGCHHVSTLPMSPRPDECLTGENIRRPYEHQRVAKASPRQHGFLANGGPMLIPISPVTRKGVKIFSRIPFNDSQLRQLVKDGLVPILNSRGFAGDADRGHPTAIGYDGLAFTKM